jgi:hypothetical protein
MFQLGQRSAFSRAAHIPSVAAWPQPKQTQASGERLSSATMTLCRGHLIPDPRSTG